MDWIDAEAEPLSFLLLLCDHLQEWDRPRVDPQFRYYLTAHLLQHTHRHPSIFTLIRHLKLSLSWNKGKRKWVFSPGDFEFELEFKDAYKENFEPAIIWFSHFFDLQKIQKEKLQRGIHIAYVHPLSQGLSKLLEERIELTEMDLFRDFIREKEDKESLSAFIFETQKGERVSYRYNEKEKKERFEIILEKLGKVEEKIIIQKIPFDLYNEFMDWKKERIKTIELKKRG